VIEAQCTGCELCVPVCPVDCIAMAPATSERTGWAAWSAVQAQAAQARYRFRTARLAREAAEHDQRLADRTAERRVAGKPAAGA
jgi:Na+-translocating ferredoxin:NAD+ oxidoreductase subunit B